MIRFIPGPELIERLPPPPPDPPLPPNPELQRKAEELQQLFGRLLGTQREITEWELDSLLTAAADNNPAHRDAIACCAASGCCVRKDVPSVVSANYVIG